MYKETLTKDLSKLRYLESASQTSGQFLTKVGFSLLFLVIVYVVAVSSGGSETYSAFIVAAGVCGMRSRNLSEASIGCFASTRQRVWPS